MSKYSQEEKLLEQIRNGYGGERLAKELFLKYKSYFIGFLVNLGCESGLAAEIYFKAFGIFYDKAQRNRIRTPLKSNLQTYINAIGKNLHLQTITQAKKNKTESLDDVLESLFWHNFKNQEHDENQQQANKELVSQILNALGDKCKTLLILSFIEGYSDDAIMRALDYDTEGAVRQQRHRCLAKCRKFIQANKPNIKN